VPVVSVRQQSLFSKEQSHNAAQRYCTQRHRVIVLWSEKQLVINGVTRAHFQKTDADN